MAKPTREEVEATLKTLPPEQHQAFLAEVERRLAEPSAGPAKPTIQQGGMFNAAQQAEGIGENPWYARNLGGVLPSAIQALEALPSIGGMVGGALASPGLVTTLPGAAAVAGAAGLGGGAGEALRQLGRRAIGIPAPQNGYQAARGIIKEGAVQAGSELLGQGIAKGAAKVLAPAAGMVDPAVEVAARRLAPEGLSELPASALSKSRAVPYAEAYAAQGFGGAQAAQRYEKAMGSMTAIADHTVARASNLADDTARGEAIHKGFEAFRQNWIQQKNAIYKEAEKLAPNFQMEAPETVKLLEDVVARKKSAANVLKGGPTQDKDFYGGLLNGLTELVEQNGKRVRVLKPVPAKDVQNAIREINHKAEAGMADPFAAANKGLLLKLAATMDDEFGASLAKASPQAAAKLQAANKVYSEGISKINSTFGEAINKFAEGGKYDLIAKAIANPRMSVADIPRIMEVAGPEGTDAMRASVLANIVGKAKSANLDNPVLTPQGLSRQMKAYGEDRLQALLTGEQYARLKDLATASGAMERGGRVMNGSPTASLARASGYGSALTGAALGHPAALVYVLGDLASTKFIASKAGQKWLTTGYLLPKSAESALRRAPAAARGAYQMANAEGE